MGPAAGWALAQAVQALVLVALLTTVPMALDSGLEAEAVVQAPMLLTTVAVMVEQVDWAIFVLFIKA